MHLHHDNTNAEGEAIAPVPSAEDVFGMSDFFKQKSDLNASDSLSIVSIVVSRRDLYAFKIRDAQKVTKFRQDLERTIIVEGKPKKYEEILKEAYKEDVQKKVIAYCQSQGGCSPELEEAVWENYFLEYLQRLDSGLSFFRAFYNPQTDTYDWEPLN
jgi:predicted AlkP superfamily phosphohydrolase/phosphomutase